MTARTDGRPHFWPYHTVEAKRELARQYRENGGLAEFGADPEFWEALADLQEQDRIDEWLARVEAWKNAEPHPRDLLKEKAS